MHLLINLDIKGIVGKFDTSADAEKAAEGAKFDFHICDAETFAGIHTLKELAELFNNLPAVVEPIERFSDRKTAIRRINEAIEKGGVTVSSKKRKRSKAKSTGAKSANKQGRAPTWNKIEVAAAGKSDDILFQKENIRYKVFEYIKKRDSVELEQLLKWTEDSLKLSRSQTMGAVAKLAIRKLVKLV